MLRRTNMRLPDLIDLRCFLAAAETLNFSKASRLVGLSPAAFGQRIANLEMELAAPLFSRSTRHVALTERGAALIAPAEVALQKANACFDADQIAPLELTIGTRHELGMDWLLPLLPELEASRANLKINLFFGSGPGLLRALRNRDCDAVVTSTSPLPGDVDAMMLAEEPYALVASPQLKRPHRATALGQETLIDIDASLPLARYLFSQVSDGLRFVDHRYMGTIAAVRALVCDGYGVAVLPTYFVRDAIKDGSLVRWFPKLALGSDAFRLAFRSDSSHRDALARLTDVLRQQSGLLR